MKLKITFISIFLILFSCSKENEESGATSENASVRDLGASGAIDAAIADDRQSPDQLSLVLAKEITASVKKASSGANLLESFPMPADMEAKLLAAISAAGSGKDDAARLMDLAIAAGAEATFEMFPGVGSDSSISITKALSDGVMTAMTTMPSMMSDFASMSSDVVSDADGGDLPALDLPSVVRSALDAVMPSATEFMMKEGALAPDASPIEMAEVMERIHPDPVLVEALSVAVAAKFEEVMNEISEANPDMQDVLEDVKSGVVVDKENIIAQMQEQISGAVQMQAFLIAEAAMRVVEPIDPPEEDETVEPEIVEEIFEKPPEVEVLSLTAEQANQIARSLLQGMIISGVRSSLDANLDGVRDENAVRQAIRALPGFVTQRIDMWFDHSSKFKLKTLMEFGHQSLDYVHGVFLAARDVYPDLFETVTKSEKGLLSKLKFVDGFESHPEFESFGLYIGTAVFYFADEVLRRKDIILALDERTRPTLVTTKLDGTVLESAEKDEFIVEFLEFVGAAALRSLEGFLPDGADVDELTASALATGMSVLERESVRGLPAIIGSVAARLGKTELLEKIMEKFMYGFVLVPEVSPAVVEIPDSELDFDFASFRDDCSLLYSLSFTEQAAINFRSGLDYKKILEWDLGVDTSLFSFALGNMGYEEIDRADEVHLLLCQLQATLMTVPDAVLLYSGEGSERDNIDFLLEEYKARLFVVINSEELKEDGSSSFHADLHAAVETFESEVNVMIADFNELNGAERDKFIFDEVTIKPVKREIPKTYSIDLESLEEMGDEI